MLYKAGSLILLVFMIMINVSCSNEPKPNSFNEVEEKINNYNNVFDVNKFNKKEVNLNELSSQGGTVIGYYEDTKLKYMITTFFGETGKKLYYYYFIDESLTYFEEIDIKYDKPIYEEGSKILRETIKKYIVLNDKLFEYKEKTRELQNIKGASNYLDILNRAKEALK